MTNCRRAGRQERLLDPPGGQVLAKPRQLVRNELLGHQLQRSFELHDDLLKQIAAS